MENQTEREDLTAVQERECEPTAEKIADEITSESEAAAPAVHVKRDNLFSLLIGVAVFALYLFALSILSADIGSVAGFGFGAKLPEVSTVTGAMKLGMEGVDFSQLVNLYYYLILLIAWLVVAVIMFVNLIRAIICLVSMVNLGQDREKMEKKSAKLHHITFGGVCSVISLAVLCSLAGDAIPSSVIILMAVSAAVYLLLLVFTAFRKKRIENKSWTMFILDLCRDLVMSALAVLAVVLLVGTPVYEASVAAQIASIKSGSEIIAVLVDIAVNLFRVCVMLVALSVLKKTAKFYPYNSAKRKDVNDILNGKYIRLLILSLTFWLVGSVLDTCLLGESGRFFVFNASMIGTWFRLLVESYLPVVLVAVAGIVLVGYVGGEERKGAAKRAG